MGWRTARIAVAAAALVALASPVVAGESSSASFALRRPTLAAAGEIGTSASYRLTPTAAQPATIGVSASPSFVLQSGFWSQLGSALVPVVLTVQPGAAPDEVDLAWSGNNAPYEVFQSLACDAVFDSSLATTPSNSLSGVGTAPTGLTCFNVLATAPGPIAPP